MKKTGTHIKRSSCRLTPGRGAWKMEFDMDIHGFIISGCRYIDNEDGRRPYVLGPAATWTDATGKIKYKNLVKIPADKKAALNSSARKTFEELMREAAL